MDHYNTRKFVCEITGNSNFTYFEALQYEKAEMLEVEKRFPEPVREPILRYVQFSTTPRIDQLVDEVYNQFKRDFFPGDFVIVKLLGVIGSEKARGYVREKARFNAITLPDGEVRKGYCSYRVTLLDENEITVNENQLSRERNSFTKWHVKTFLKLTLTRGNRVGAPWIVRDKYAEQYRIPTEYPENLLEYSVPDQAVVRGKKRTPAVPKRLKIKREDVINIPDIFSQMKETPPLNTSEDRAVLQSWKDSWYDILKRCHVYFDFDNDDTSDLSVRNKVYQLFAYAGVTALPQFDPERTNFIISLRPYNSKELYANDDIYRHVHTRNIKVWHYEKVFRFFKSLSITMRKISQMERAKTEDLKSKSKFVDILPAPQLGQDSPRPGTNGYGDHSHAVVRKGAVDDLALTFQVTNWKPAYHRFENSKYVSELLETWCFLNIYGTPLVIDSFTFDDFVAALSWDDSTTRCDLLEEIFCSTLKAILDEKYKPGSGRDDGLLVTLPRALHDDEDDEEVEEEKEAKADADAEVKASADPDEEKTEGSNGKPPVEAEPEESDPEDSEEEEEINHNAYAVLEYKNLTWQERLKRRSFKDGGWQVILIGVLSLVDFVPQFKDTINDILENIAPVDEITTPMTVQVNFYERLGLDLKVKALSIVCSLLVNGSVIRNHIDKCLEEATQLRRIRLEHIRDYKANLEEARSVQILITEALGVPVASSDINSPNSTPAPQAADEQTSKKRRRGRFANLPPVEPTDEEVAFGSANPEFLGLLKQRGELMKKVEESKALRKQYERRLNEIDVQRVRYVGRDREYNRYWWFESNGLPTLKSVRNKDDDEDEEEEEDDDVDNPVEDESFLMGRLWIQGPSDEDRKSFLKFPDEELQEWRDIVESTMDTDEVQKRSESKAESNNGAETTQVQTSDQLDNYTKVPAGFARAAKEKFGLVFENGIVKDVNDFTIVDQYGATTSKEYHPMERKILEEGPECLLNSEDWRYIDSADDINSLLKWLNPAGKRELQLRKELLLLQDNIKSSMVARKKALGLGQKSDQEEELERILKETVISDTEESEEEDLGSETPDAESEPETPSAKPRTRRSIAALEIEEQKEKAVKEKAAKKALGPSARIANREAKRRKIKEHSDKRRTLENAAKELDAIRSDKSRNSVLQWVNSIALETLGHLHSEPPVKRGRPPTKKGRK
ncbi:unnamed protein product [Kuraishia capsulata CBS 1993]|uniref:WAC domain-containing protein n=1 Tax=Kuraishia capsulata CBS 1993 TaxID=1382522 RepID=W6MQ02_9ASCO|nr:uncharacterized protein KUCA_T00003280001 [Kuraishia capsulata CBS 1993]CDK27302.1 unnamed protein product [Kuraishia capsulata CBS 1993]